VLDRHERRAEALDHSFDLHEQLVVARLDLDADLVDRVRVEPRIAERLQQAVAVRDARSLSLSVFAHPHLCPP